MPKPKKPKRPKPLRIGLCNYVEFYEFHKGITEAVYVYGGIHRSKELDRLIKSLTMHREYLKAINAKK